MTAKEYRAKLVARMAAYEAEGGEAFFRNVEEDPPSRPLLPGEVDYLRHRLSSRIKGAFAGCIEALAFRLAKRKHRITLQGESNLASLSGGFIMTGNHFAKDESLCARAIACAAGRATPYKVVREGNFFMPGLIGFLLKHCRTLPLSSNLHTMGELDAAIRVLLSRGESILLYPEQAMWQDYPKPRPYRIGAFHYAAKNGVPILPYFVTLSPISGRRDKAGYPVQQYTVHILPPLYPDPNKTVRENAETMRAENAAATRRVYEDIYGIPLTYGNT